MAGLVGDQTFAGDRWMNQEFYRSSEWRRIRRDVILRDEALNLGMPGYEIADRPVVHHMNPMVIADIADGDEAILDPEFLITTTHLTHNAIHYGNEEQLPKPFVPRAPGDTNLW